jgi:hypothetical protein
LSTLPTRNLLIFLVFTLEGNFYRNVSKNIPIFYWTLLFTSALVFTRSVIFWFFDCFDFVLNFSTRFAKLVVFSISKLTQLSIKAFDMNSAIYEQTPFWST